MSTYKKGGCLKSTEPGHAIDNYFISVQNDLVSFWGKAEIVCLTVPRRDFFGLICNYSKLPGIGQ